MKLDDERHGTYAGAMAHQREGSTKCRPCKDAAAEYMRRRRATSQRARDLDRAQQRAYRVAERALRQRHRDEFDELYEQARHELGL